METRYDILVLGSREKFTEWIRDRVGVAVWSCVNLSNPMGPTFTPAVTNGAPTKRPGWQMASAPTEVVTDIARFRFASALREVDRLKIYLRPRDQSFTTKLTEASYGKLCKRLRNAQGQHPDAVFRFDYGSQEAVIETPEWESQVLVSHVPKIS